MYFKDIFSRSPLFEFEKSEKEEKGLLLNGGNSSKEDAQVLGRERGWAYKSTEVLIKVNRHIFLNSNPTLNIHCRQRQDDTERQLFPFRALHAGVLRQEVQDQGLRHPGLSARAVEDHHAVDRREKLPHLLPADCGGEGK